tara:strand:+ start:4434 stop:4949 length:516 start_codon:yes stop_codon:yes gene_type:complete
MLKKVVWFTGLSGVGKSTISNELFKKLRKRKYKVLKIDGDVFRKKKKYKKKFTKKIIYKNNFEIIKKVKSIRNKYDYTLVSVISPLYKTRKYSKNLFKKLYYEIFLYCSLKTLKKRDTKGLYKKADMKIINNLIGYKSKISYEKSKYKVLKIKTDKYSIAKSVSKTLEYIL